MDTFCDPTISSTVVKSSAQIGKTEILLNVLGYHADQDPCPVLVLQPTLDMSEAFSKDRLAPMLRDTPCLKGRVKDARGRDSGNTLLHKVYPGGHITMAGANSPSSLASRPVRITLCDEVDRYPVSAGTEGDPVDLARKRSQRFWNRKHGEFSTPTIEGLSRIDTSFNLGDQRRFFVACHRCHEIQFLAWEQVKFNDHDPATARYECAHCQESWTDPQRWKAVANGEWHATAEFTGIASFHIWEAYAPDVELSSIVREFLKVKDHPERLKTWVNTCLGETWKEKGEAPEAQRLYERAESYPIGQVPQRALFLTAGVDVQKDRIEASIYGWGRGKESWLIDHVVLDGYPTQTTPIRLENGTVQRPVWDRITDLLNSTWRHESGADLSLMRMGIDTGYSTNEVYTWVRMQGGGRVLGLDPHGRETSAIVGQPSPVDVTIGGKKIKRGVKVWPVAVSKYKSELYGWLRMDRPEADMPMPGYCHYPQMQLSFFQQLTNEQLVQKTNRAGFRVSEWVKTGANEALDCRNYARACAAVIGIDRFSERDWLALEAQLGVVAPPLPVQQAVVQQRDEEIEVLAPVVERRSGGWLPRRGNWF